jgi:hypothetical protein
VEDGAVRGGYLLLMREFFLGGRVRTVAHCRLPVSEGLIDRAYSSVGMRLLRSAVQQQPLVFALGMGGMHNPLPRLLDALGWRLWPVPFYFKAIRPTRCLRQIQALRASTIRRVLTDTAAATGLGWIGLKTVQTLRSRAHGAVRCETVTEFGAWADEIWEDCAKQYAMIATRDSRTLNQMYPASSARFIRLRAKDGGRMSGWVVVLDTQMYGDRHFGNLRVGTIADCLAPPEFVSTSILAATRALQERGVDLIISNQMHVDWGAALRRAGFLRGPSNFIFAASKQLAEALSPFEAACRRSHMNRGDGDGPVNL